MSLSQEEKVTLDMSAFKALASDTRVNILKALDDRQKTVSELARELNMNKATMYQHLEQLTVAGLVRKLDGPERLKTVKHGPHEAPAAGPPRKWVYYRLTFKGKNVVSPGKVRFAIMLSIFAVIGVAVILLLFANAVLMSSPGHTYRADTTAPIIDMWNAPSLSTTDTDYKFTVEIYDLPTVERERISGIDPAGVSFHYGIADREKGTTPNIQDWTSVDHTSSGHVYTVRIRELDMTDKGGMYIYLKVEARDLKGNTNESVRHVYIVKHTEADLIFGDNGIYGGDNGLYGDNGIYLEGGGGARSLYNIGVQVTNIGDEDAGSFTIGVYTIDVDKDDDGHPDKGGGVYSDYLLVSFSVNEVRVGEVRNLSEEIVISDMKWLEAPDKGGGVYWVIDVNDEVKEQDEVNNIKTTTAPPELIEDISKFGSSPTDKSAEGAMAPGFELVVVLAGIAIAIMFRYRAARE